MIMNACSHRQFSGPIPTMPVTLELWRTRLSTAFHSPLLRAVTQRMMVCCLIWSDNGCRGVPARANRILDRFMQTVHMLDVRPPKSISSKLRWENKWLDLRSDAYRLYRSQVNRCLDKFHNLVNGLWVLQPIEVASDFANDIFSSLSMRSTNGSILPTISISPILS